ncbi:MAG: VWA domain-containing protein, partial [Clostridiales Family XIII bacterium]|nr:VWA domain-containing protein [Clostridiales Family XIII bacterium]
MATANILTNNLTARVTAAGTELTLNAKNYRYDSAYYIGATAYSATNANALKKFTFKDWNVASSSSATGFFYYYNPTTSPTTVVFDGLKFSGTTAAFTNFYATADVTNLVLDGSRAPVDIRLSNWLTAYGRGITMIGQVDITTTKTIAGSVDGDFIVKQAPAGAAHPTAVNIKADTGLMDSACRFANLTVEPNTTLNFVGPYIGAADACVTNFSIGENATFAANFANSGTQDGIWATSKIDIGAGAHIDITASGTAGTGFGALATGGTMTIGENADVNVSSAKPSQYGALYVGTTLDIKAGAKLNATSTGTAYATIHVLKTATIGEGAEVSVSSTGAHTVSTLYTQGALDIKAGAKLDVTSEGTQPYGTLRVNNGALTIGESAEVSVTSEGTNGGASGGFAVLDVGNSTMAGPVNIGANAKLAVTSIGSAFETFRAYNAATTIGEGAQVDITSSGYVSYATFATNALTIKEGAKFRVLAFAGSAYPALWTNGAVTITNPAEFTVYNSSTTANAARFLNNAAIDLTFSNLTYWNTTQGSLDEMSLPDVNWNSAEPFNVKGSAHATGTTAAAGNFAASLVMAPLATGQHTVSGQVEPYAFSAANFTWAGRKLISTEEGYNLTSYNISFRDYETGELLDPAAFSSAYANPYAGTGYILAEIPVPQFDVTGYLRTPSAPETVALKADPADNEFDIFYYADGFNPDLPETIDTAKTAERVGENLWKVTLNLNGSSGVAIESRDVDIMIVLDASTSMNTTSGGRTRIAATKAAAIRMLDELTQFPDALTGITRVGLVKFSSNNANSTLLQGLTPVMWGQGNEVYTDAINALKAKINAITLNTSTYTNRGISLAYTEQFVTNPSTRSHKYMVLLSDGATTSSARTAAVTAANQYKNAGGKLIAVGLDISGTATTNLMTYQNAGYYNATGANVEDIFIEIVRSMLTNIKNGVVTDPMGAGFEITDVNGGSFEIGTDVSVDHGTLTYDAATKTLKWTFTEQIASAQLTYYVKLTNPNAVVNTPSATNGETYIIYDSHKTEGLREDFDVPYATYAFGSLIVQYNGVTHDSQTFPVGYPDVPPSGHYPTRPTYQFTGPEDLQNYSLKVRLTGTEAVGDTIYTRNIEAASLAELNTLLGGDRITARSGNLYEIDSPQGNLVITYDYTLLGPFHVTYDHNVPNGATAIGSAPTDANEYWSGDTAIIKGQNGMLVEGYRFSGWLDADDTLYAQNDEVVITGDLPLKAQWTAADAVLLSFNANLPTDATLQSGAVPAAQSHALSATVTLPGNTGSLVVPGYDFQGWSRTADAADVTTGIITQIVNIAEDTVLYAVWKGDGGGEPIKYTVTYNIGDANGGTAPVDTSSPYLRHSNVTVLGNTGSLVKYGRSFTGWATVSGGTLVYAVGETISDLSVPVSLYPAWSTGADEKINIIFDVNGNNEGGSNVSREVTKHQPVDSLATLRGTHNLIKYGYDFDGWSTTANDLATVTDTLPGQAADTTVYAYWLKDTNDGYTVTYNKGTADTGTVPVDSTVYLKHQSAVALTNSGGLTKYGTEFLGWTLTENGGEVNYLQGDPIHNIVANLNLYPVWGEAASYPVIYNANAPVGELKSGSVPATVSYPKYSPVTIAGNSGSLVRLGYDFEGWSLTQQSAPDQAVLLATSIASIEEATTLYAVWSGDGGGQPERFTVTYVRGAEATGGTVPADSLSPYLKHADVTVLGNTGNLVAEGKNFAAWADGASYYLAGDTRADITADLTFTPWFGTGSVTLATVTYNANLPSGADIQRGSVPDSLSVPINTTATLAAPTGLVVPGYDFQGWSLTPNAADVFIGIITNIPSIAADTTVYAVWKGNGDGQPITFTVTYNSGDANGGTAPVDTS